MTPSTRSHDGEPSRATARAGSAIQPGPRLVLVADDDDDFRGALVACLEQAGGIDVIEARDGWEAVSLALQVRPEILLLDYRMPGLNGAEVLRELHGEGAAPIAVLVTAANEPDELARVVGVSYFLAKPFSADELLAVIDRAASGE